MNLDNISNQIYIVAFNEAKLQGHEFVTPEHILYSALLFECGKDILENSGADIKRLLQDLNEFFDSYLEKVDNRDPIESFELINLFENASSHAGNSEKNKISLGDILISFFELTESYGAYIMLKNGIKKLSLLKYISHGITDKDNNIQVKSDDIKSEKTEKETEFLNKYTTEMTSLALEKKLDPFIGREDVINRTIQILSRRIKNNPVHVGDPGIGKTAITEGLAQKIADKNVPDSLKNSKIYYLDIASVLAGTKYRGDFEERLVKILDIIMKDQKPIRYIDEIHLIVGAGAVSGNAVDAAGILKPYLLKSNLKIIGSTTHNEYKKYFEKDRALARRFQKIEIFEPSVNDCIKILDGLKHKYEKYHNVKYTDDAIKSACTLSDKYINDKRLPDKAIDIIDEAGAYCRLNAKNKKNIIIDVSIIQKIISQTAKIPVEKISENESEKLKNLEDELNKVIFGQKQAINAVVNAVKASRSGLNDSERPVANLLFVGPTGVGKTELVKQLSNKLDIPLKRFDMSEYQEKHSVSRLIGSPPGYVGYDEGGLLTDTINQTPHCVLLLDEIEKAHPDIFNILLQVMDYGKLTDNTGRQSDFRNVIIIMTSNAGAKFIDKHVIGFEDKTLNDDAVNSEVKKVFSPEFRNRLDDIVLFNNISMENAILIAKKSIELLSERLKPKNIKLKVSENAVKHIAEKGYSKTYGARKINRVTEDEIKKPLIDQVLFGKLSKGGTVYIDAENNMLSLKYRKLPLKK